MVLNEIYFLMKKKKSQFFVLWELFQNLRNECEETSYLDGANTAR